MSPIQVVKGSVVVEEVKEKSTNTGFDANTSEFVDMFERGIIDPTKVARTALQNAASIAGLMLTTEVMITELKEDEEVTNLRLRAVCPSKMTEKDDITILKKGHIYVAFFIL